MARDVPPKPMRLLSNCLLIVLISFVVICKLKFQHLPSLIGAVKKRVSTLFCLEKATSSYMEAQMPCSGIGRILGKGGSSINKFAHVKKFVDYAHLITSVHMHI